MELTRREEQIYADGIRFGEQQERERLGYPAGHVPKSGCIGRLIAMLARARAQGNQVIAIDAVEREIPHA